MVSIQGCVWFDIQCLGMTGYAEPVMLKQRSNCNHAMKNESAEHGMFTEPEFQSRSQNLKFRAHGCVWWVRVTF